MLEYAIVIHEEKKLISTCDSFKTLHTLLTV